MNIKQEQIIAKQAGFYSKKILHIYDMLVLGILNHSIWKCPTRFIVNHYNTHISSNHLDVGVGTGYFLDRCRFPIKTPRIGLMDLNQAPLDFVQQRISHYQPETYKHNVLSPVNHKIRKFDSVGLNYLLHCIPGTIKSKAVVFDHLKTLVKPNGILFGSTLLQDGVPRTLFAKHLMTVYNEKGIFSNRADHLTGLIKELTKRFNDISIEVVGCAVLFTARV